MVPQGGAGGGVDVIQKSTALARTKAVKALPASGQPSAQRQIGSLKEHGIGIVAASGPAAVLVGSSGAGAGFSTRVTMKEERDADLALAMRVRWMRATGVPESIIAEYSDLELHPVDLAEELENLKALEDLPRNRLSRTELQAIAARSPSPDE